MMWHFVLKLWIFIIHGQMLPEALYLHLRCFELAELSDALVATGCFYVSKVQVNNKIINMVLEHRQKSLFKVFSCV